MAPDNNFFSLHKKVCGNGEVLFIVEINVLHILVAEGLGSLCYKHMCCRRYRACCWNWGRSCGRL